MKKTGLVIFAVMALLAALVLPTVAFADDGAGWVDANLGAALGLNAAGAANDQGFGGFGSDTDQTARIFNMPVQLGMAGGMQTSKIFGESEAMSIAKSGWQVSVGSVQLVNLEPKQYASADAHGNIDVAVKAGDSNTKNFGDAYAGGGTARSIARGADAYGGDIDVDSGNTDAGIFNKAFGMANGGGNADAGTLASGNNLALPIAASGAAAGVINPSAALGGLAAGVNVADDCSDDGAANATGGGATANPWGQASAWSQANAAANQTGGGNASAWAGGNDPASNCFNQGGTVGVANPAWNTGSTGAVNAWNTAGPATANGGTPTITLTGAAGGAATAYGIGNFGGTAVNSMGAISVGNTGTASGSTGAATTGATTSNFTATSSNCDTAADPFTQSLATNPAISQMDSDPQSVNQQQWANPNAALSQMLSQAAGSNYTED